MVNGRPDLLPFRIHNAIIIIIIIINAGVLPNPRVEDYCR